MSLAWTTIPAPRPIRALTCAVASYYLVERPALRVRATLERRAAAARRQRELAAQAAG